METVSNSAVDDGQNEYSDAISRRTKRQINYWTTKRNPNSNGFEAHPRIGPQSNYRPTQPPSRERDIPYVPVKRACSLYIQTDTYLWDHFKKNEPSDTKAREEIASLVAQHIKAVNHIYETSVFKVRIINFSKLLFILNFLLP